MSIHRFIQILLWKIENQINKIDDVGRGLGFQIYKEQLLLLLLDV